jgi:hypothetical protein
MKKGGGRQYPGVTIMKSFYNHMSDPYDAKKDMTREEYAKHMSILRSREGPFRTNKKEAYTFQEDFEVYGEDGCLIK